MFEKLKLIFRILFNNNSDYYGYPCKDVLHYVLDDLKDGNLNAAYKNVYYVLERAGDIDTITKEEITTFKKIKNMEKEYYNDGFQTAIRYIKNHIAFCARFGFDGSKMIKLDKSNSDENVGYIQVTDILQYAEEIRQRNLVYDRH